MADFKQIVGNVLEKAGQGVQDVVQKIKSNLSETAQLVNEVMIAYITPILRSEGLVQNANEIIKEKLEAQDPKVIEFATKCRKVQSEIYQKAQASGCNDKQLAVISNYFAKLIPTVKNSNSSPKPVEPIEPVEPTPNLRMYT